MLAQLPNFLFEDNIYFIIVLFILFGLSAIVHKILFDKIEYTYLLFTYILIITFMVFVDILDDSFMGIALILFAILVYIMIKKGGM